MSLKRFASRNVKTALRLPAAAIGDVLTLGKFGEGTYVGDVLDEHRVRKATDDVLDDLEDLASLFRF